jgi:hypothetical protein
MLNRIINLEPKKQITLGVFIAVGAFAISMIWAAAIIATSDVRDHAYDIFAYMYTGMWAAGISGLMALVLYIVKFPWIALGIIIIDALPLLVTVGCFGMMK